MIVKIILEFLGFLLLLTLFLNYISYHSWNLNSNLIKHNINIRRDENGIPHVSVKNKLDAQFALGFLHAEDRLWQMYMSYYIFTGDMSRMFNSDVLVIDRISHVLNTKNNCKFRLEHISSEEKEMYQSYSNGVNLYLENTTILPLEFYILGIFRLEKWDAYKTCISFKLTEFLMTFDFLQESLRTYMKEKLDVPEEEIVKVFPFHINHNEYKTTIIKNNEVSSIKPLSKNEYRMKFGSFNHFNMFKSHEENKMNLNIDNKNLNNSEEINIKDNKEVLNLYGHGGSNNCIISGKYTENGFPILCNDPHLLAHIPVFWYLSYIKIEEDNFEIFGVSHSGSSCMLIGQNGYLSWGITNGLSDVANIFRVLKSSQTKYIIDNKEKELSYRVENICVGKYCKKEKFYYIDELGPVLNGYLKDIYRFFEHGDFGETFFEEDKYFYVLRSDLSSENSSLLKVLVNYQYFKTSDEFRENLRYQTMPSNVVFTDKFGDIYYQHTGKIPIHYNDNGEVISNNFDFDKNKHLNIGYSEIIKSSEQLLVDFIPFDHMPFVKNPDKGFVVSANNNVIPDNYPYFIPGAYYPDYRARSLEERLYSKIENCKKTGEKISIKWVKDNLINNIYDPWVLDVLKNIRIILKNNDILNNKYFIEMLNFNGEFEYNSKSALIYTLL